MSIKLLYGTMSQWSKTTVQLHLPTSGEEQVKNDIHSTYLENYRHTQQFFFKRKNTQPAECIIKVKNGKEKARCYLNVDAKGHSENISTTQLNWDEAV